MPQTLQIRGGMGGGGSICTFVNKTQKKESLFPMFSVDSNLELRQVVMKFGSIFTVGSHCLGKIALGSHNSLVNSNWEVLIHW